VRLFVALELPPPVAQALVEWAPRDEALRSVPLESIHVTMAFLGERPESDVDAITAAMQAVRRPAGEARLARATWLPPRRARVLAVELDAPDVVALQADLSAALDWTPEKRPFLAHVTVARVRSGRKAPRAALPPLPEAGAFRPGPLTLFRSLLSPRGAHYEVISRASLELP
jgi:RNA 2',3'-cyclic 3'-phosphodiesterase